MARKVVLGSAAAALICLGLAGAASASAPIQLALSQGAAFSILGHSCGGIQEKTYATGFGGPHGMPTGDVYMQTRCGGSGRGGGYHVTTYSAWASVVWTWFGETFSFSRLEGPPAATKRSKKPTHTATASTTPARPRGSKRANLRSAARAAHRGQRKRLALRSRAKRTTCAMQVGWTRADETAGLITSSTVDGDSASAPRRPCSARPSARTGAAPPSSRRSRTRPTRVTVTEHRLRRDERTERAIEITTPNSDGEVEPPPGGGIRCEQDQGTIKLVAGARRNAARPEHHRERPPDELRRRQRRDRSELHRASAHDRRSDVLDAVERCRSNRRPNRSRSW